VRVVLTSDLSSERYDRTTPVLILKTSAQPLHHGTLGVIRSLGRTGVPVYSSLETGSPPAATSRYLSPDIIGVLSPSDPELNIGALKAFQGRVGRPVVIVPVDDNGALFLAENADALRPALLLPPQRPDLPRAVASKANIPHLCAMANAATPETLILSTAEDLAAASSAIRYPAVVKIAQPWLLPLGLRPAFLAHCREDVVEYQSLLRARSMADIVVQEYIPDEHAEDWFYHGYHREGGEPVVGFTGRKIRSYPPFFGATSYGLSIVNEEILAVSQRILRQLGYAGIVELEFRLDKRDRQYKFVDFNPRLGAQFQFLRNESGIDVVRAMHLDLTGRDVPDGRQVEGCAFLSDFADPAAFVAYWRQGTVGPGGWLRQVLGANEHSWFASDDIRPFTAAFGHSAKRFLSSAMRPNPRREQSPPGAPLKRTTTAKGSLAVEPFPSAKSEESVEIAQAMKAAAGTATARGPSPVLGRTWRFRSRKLSTNGVSRRRGRRRRPEQNRRVERSSPRSPIYTRIFQFLSIIINSVCFM
jgi:D-aspartate ligase